MAAGSMQAGRGYEHSTDNTRSGSEICMPVPSEAATVTRCSEEESGLLDKYCSR